MECLFPEIVNSRMKRSMPVREPVSTLKAIKNRGKENDKKKQKEKWI